MKFLFTFLFSSVTFLLVCGQTTFVKSIDIDEQSDEGVAIRVISDGYLLLAGSYCFSNTLNCYSILKTDFNGNVIWKKQLKNNSAKIKPVDGYSNHGISVMNKGDEIFFCGIIENQETLLDCFLMKTDDSGDSIWFRTYGSPFDDFSSTIFQRTDSTLLLFSDLSSDSNNDVIWLLETDLTGNVIWENTYGELNRNVARQDILQLENGEIIFTHFSCDREDICYFGDTITLNITKINKQGNVIWSKPAYKFTEYWSNNSMIALDNGGFLLSFHRVNFESGWFYPPILIWLDSLGQFDHEYHFPSEPESVINDIIKTSTGTIIGVGYVDKFELGFAGWMFALSQDGDLLWNREIIKDPFLLNVLSFNAIEEDNTGGFIITGVTFPTETDKNIVLAKLDSQGCLEPECNDLQIITSELIPTSESQECILYPNPVTNELKIKVNLECCKQLYKSVIIRNNLGQIIKSKTIDDEITNVDFSDFFNGVYFVQILDERGMTTQTNKVVVSK